MGRLGLSCLGKSGFPWRHRYGPRGPSVVRYTAVIARGSDVVASVLKRVQEGSGSKLLDQESRRGVSSVPVSLRAQVRIIKDMGILQQGELVGNDVVADQYIKHFEAPLPMVVVKGIGHSPGWMEARLCHLMWQGRPMARSQSGLIFLLAFECGGSLLSANVPLTLCIVYGPTYPLPDISAVGVDVWMLSMSNDA
ncbi:hypothetical protein OsJ_10887 [Oryza sativa Japonica Group]|nr:hypothetical protein LOC_Os03g24140 [Oryza sativa Japonica Group]EAZ26961.1 hypothetical protein OsJ_10887 [Oryza sativa Japonica Group]